MTHHMPVPGYFPSVEEWRGFLPKWFVDACGPTLSREDAEAWLAAWRTLDLEGRRAAGDARRWALEDWLYWFDPSSYVDRGWAWWDAGVIDDDRYWIEVEVEGDPAPVGTLMWLMKAAGASVITEEP